LHLPEDILFRPDRMEVAGDGFSYRRQFGKQDRVLELRHEYVSLTDSLEAVLTAQHIRDVDRVWEATSFYVQFPNPAAPLSLAGVNWTIAIMGLLWALLVAGAAVIAYRYRPTPAVPPPLVDAKLEGIGGWLILVMIGVLFRPAVLVWAIVDNAGAYAPENWLALTSPTGGNYHALWGPLLIFELLANLALLGLSLLVVILFFQKRRTFPGFFIVLLIAGATLISLDHAALRSLSLEGFDLAEPNPREPVRSIINALIWTLYTIKSRRVKATFRN
jgi:hypothetical protein